MTLTQPAPRIGLSVGRRGIRAATSVPINASLVSSRHESGAALVVALVLILVSALLGVSVMESSTLETRLVANDQARESVFRVAEASAGRLLTPANISLLLAGDEIAAATSVDDRASVTVVPQVVDVGPVYNSSIGLFQNYLVSTTATAIATDGVTRRVVTQGAAQRAPATQR